MNKAILPFRIWGIRHIRAAVHLYKMNRHYEFYGKYFGALPLRMSDDMKIIEQIRKGEL